jgi:hypothetical protein
LRDRLARLAPGIGLGRLGRLARLPSLERLGEDAT